MQTLKSKICARNTRPCARVSTSSGAAGQRGDRNDWLLRAYFFDRFNYWTFIHTDDSTQAFEKAFTADFQGAHALFVNSDRNYLSYDAEALLSLIFPAAPAARKRWKPRRRWSI